MVSRPSQPKKLSKMSRLKSGEHVALERVLGFTAIDNCAVSFDVHSASLIYASGCVVVAESCTTNHQSFIQNASQKAITCLDVSPDGKFVATGELGKLPKVRIWNRVEHCQVAEFAGHEHRINCIRFSPNGRLVISVGNQEDKAICVWDRIKLQKISSARITINVKAIAFNDNGQFFVTVGTRYVRYWYLNHSKARITGKETQPLVGRNAMLKDLSSHLFTDVCCVNPFALSSSGSATNTAAPSEGQNLVLILSQEGHLFQFSEMRRFEKWVNLKAKKASCLAVSAATVAVGCASGDCFLFHAVSLDFIGRVPLPHTLGIDVQQYMADRLSALFPAGCNLNAPRYPDVIAMKMDFPKGLLVCMYSDHSLHCWDMKNLLAIGRRFSHFYHSRGLGGIDIITTRSTGLEASGAPGDDFCDNPVDHFATCSDDGTVRLWSFLKNPSTFKSSNLFTDGRESVSIIYTDREYTHLCRIEVVFLAAGPRSFLGLSQLNVSAPNSPSLVRSRRRYPSWEAGSTSGGLGSQDAESSACNLRSVAVSPGGLHLAVGDKSGQLRIYDLKTFKLLHSIPAHEKEILCLSYLESKTVPGLWLLCSASRDRVIHVFQPLQEYLYVLKIDDHSGGVNAARFVESEEEHKIYLASCGTDRSLLFRKLLPDAEGMVSGVFREHFISETHSHADAVVVGPTLACLEKLAVAAASPQSVDTPPIIPPSPQRAHIYLAVACQDRHVRIFNVTRGRLVTSYRVWASDDGNLSCCAVDPTNTLIAVAGYNKQVSLNHLFSGIHIANLYGHSEVITGLLFLPDLRHLVSVSCDTCIFVWRLPPRLTALMQQRHQMASVLLSTPSAADDINQPISSSRTVAGPQCVFRSRSSSPRNLSATANKISSSFYFNESELPTWARRSCTFAVPTDDLPTSSTLPRRVGPSSVVAAAHLCKPGSASTRYLNDRLVDCHLQMAVPPSQPIDTGVNGTINRSQGEHMPLGSRGSSQRRTASFRRQPRFANEKNCRRHVSLLSVRGGTESVSTSSETDDKNASIWASNLVLRNQPFQPPDIEDPDTSKIGPTADQSMTLGNRNRPSSFNGLEDDGLANSSWASPMYRSWTGGSHFMLDRVDEDADRSADASATLVSSSRLSRHHVNTGLPRRPISFHCNEDDRLASASRASWPVPEFSVPSIAGPGALPDAVSQPTTATNRIDQSQRSFLHTLESKKPDTAAPFSEYPNEIDHGETSCDSASVASGTVSSTNVSSDSLHSQTANFEILSPANAKTIRRQEIPPSLCAVETALQMVLDDFETKDNPSALTQYQDFVEAELDWRFSSLKKLVGLSVGTHCERTENLLVSPGMGFNHAPPADSSLDTASSTSSSAPNSSNRPILDELVFHSSPLT